MKKFTDIIKEYEDFTAVGGASNEQIKEAEEELGLKFSKEYKEFLKEYGAACANGHEFLGICDSKRLDIVDATLKAKKKNELISDEMYLIEDVGIDKILTWQNSDGKLFQSVGKGEPEPIKMNLAEYVDG